MLKKKITSTYPNILSVKSGPTFLINSPKLIQCVESFLLKGKITLDKTVRSQQIDKSSHIVKCEFENIQQIRKGREN